MGIFCMQQRIEYIQVGTVSFSSKFRGKDSQGKELNIQLKYLPGGE